MLISERMARELSEELVNEYWAAIQYTMVSAYFSREALPQLATLFRQQASEELMHAQKIADYVTETGGVVEVPPIPAGQADFASVEEAVEARYRVPGPNVGPARSLRPGCSRGTICEQRNTLPHA